MAEDLDDYGLDPDDDSDVAFLERLKISRERLGRLIGDYDAALGFTTPGELASGAVLAALDAVIAAEDDELGERGIPDEPPAPPAPHLRPVD